jgi:hypothetical protein
MRVAGEENGSGGTSAEAVEGRTTGAVTLADAIQQGILKEEAAGKDGQARGLGQHKNVAIFEQGRELRRRFGLFPRKTMIDKEVARDEERVGKGRPPIKQDLTAPDLLPPYGLGRMAVASGIEIQDGGAGVGSRDSVRVAMAAVLHSQ